MAILVIVAGGGALLVRTKVPSFQVGGVFRIHAKFRDGSRLATGSPVVIAGVRVGTIVKLTVEGPLARVDMVLQDGLDLPVGSFATRRADSLFGDSYIEIIPATADDGADTAQRMKSGDQISHIIEGGSTDAILRGIATALPKIDSALDTVHDVVLSRRTWVTGPLSDRITGVADWLGSGHIEGPIESADHAVRRFDDWSARGGDAVANAQPAIARTLGRVDDAITSTRTRMRDIKTGLSSALHDTRDALDDLDPKIDQATEIMTAVNEGHGDDWRGTLGKLVNDAELGETLDDLSAGGRDAAAGLVRFKSWLGMRIELDAYSQAVRFYASAELRSHADKFYLFEFERGPLGGVPSDELSEVVGSGAYVRQQTIPDRLRFTAQAGKQLGRFAVRGGIKDSTFGVGADAWLLADRLKLSADLYGAFDATPRLKLTGALAVFRSVYVLAGIDDALNRPGHLAVITGNTSNPKIFEQVRYGRDYFLGTMLQFNDEDLSVLLRIYGAALVGLL